MEGGAGGRGRRHACFLPPSPPHTHPPLFPSASLGSGLGPPERWCLKLTDLPCPSCLLGEGVELAGKLAQMPHPLHPFPTSSGALGVPRNPAWPSRRPAFQKEEEHWPGNQNTCLHHMRDPGRVSSSDPQPLPSHHLSSPLPTHPPHEAMFVHSFIHSFTGHLWCARRSADRSGSQCPEETGCNRHLQGSPEYSVTWLLDMSRRLSGDV